jgi:hypothetical protein
MTDVQKAYKRAMDLLIERWFKGCDDAAMWIDMGFIVAAQHNPTMQDDPVIGPHINELLFKYVRTPDKLARLMKAAGEATQIDIRQRFLIAYVEAIFRRGRFPYVREIRSNIESRGGRRIVPDKRVIRRIADELSLPLTRTPGRPKN